MVASCFLAFRVSAGFALMALHSHVLRPFQTGFCGGKLPTGGGSVDAGGMQRLWLLGGHRGGSSAALAVGQIAGISWG